MTVKEKHRGGVIAHYLMGRPPAVALYGAERGNWSPRFQLAPACLFGAAVLAGRR